MFVVARSIFWLTAAYLVIKPGTDLPDTGTLAAQAMAAGHQVVATQVDAIACSSLECLGGKAIATAVLHSAAPVTVTAEQPQTDSMPPLPRPRPNSAG